VREAHRESVITALEQLEYYTQARIGGSIRQRLQANSSPRNSSTIQLVQAN
jgi:hypothetical protein